MNKWYWIMPNTILFAKDLSDKQKLLYVFISSLCAKKWYSWASNKYLSETLWFSSSWCSKSLNDMFKKGYINIEIASQYRNITLALHNHPPSTPVLHNSISNNTIEKKKIHPKAEFTKHWLFVKLLEKDLAILNTKFWKESVEAKIEDMNDYCWANGKRYSNYYLALNGRLKKDWKAKPETDKQWVEFIDKIKQKGESIKYLSKELWQDEYNRVYKLRSDYRKEKVLSW